MAEDDEGGRTEAARLPMLPPVATRAELPAQADDGALCFVRDEQRSYVFASGEWKPHEKRST